MNDELAPIERSFGNDSDWFRVTVNFPTNMYMEIKQIRSYSLQSLIGNAGGYVGLLVGYSISQLPVLLLLVYRFFAKGELKNNNLEEGKSTNRVDAKPTKIDTAIIESCKALEKCSELEKQLRLLKIRLGTGQINSSK